MRALGCDQDAAFQFPVQRPRIRSAQTLGARPDEPGYRPAVIPDWGTVRNYTSDIFKKLGVSDRTQAAVAAIRYGLVDLKDTLGLKSGYLYRRCTMSHDWLAKHNLGSENKTHSLDLYASYSFPERDKLTEIPQRYSR
ncbi:MAG: hypothetical protein MZV70_17360 [Desulfobacterales bacterium]|nr:hypothetical protein [Desulfobacterales bacterium]